MDSMCQMQADQLGVVVRRPASLETTALGSAFLAGLAVGVWPGLDAISSTWRADAEFEPRASRDEVDSAYAGWTRAVERARGWAQEEGVP